MTGSFNSGDLLGGGLGRVALAICILAAVALLVPIGLASVGFGAILGVAGSLGAPSAAGTAGQPAVSQTIPMTGLQSVPVGIAPIQSAVVAARGLIAGWSDRAPLNQYSRSNYQSDASWLTWRNVDCSAAALDWLLGAYGQRLGSLDDAIALLGPRTGISTSLGLLDARGPALARALAVRGLDPREPHPRVPAHGTVAEAGVEEWGEFAAQLRFLREELPLEERQALLERWDRMLSRALPDLQLAGEQRESILLALEAAAAEGAAWVALEDRMPLDQGAGVAPVLRPAVWTLDWEAPGSSDEDDGDHEDEVLVMKAADGRTDARFVLADRLVLAHLAADVRGLLAEGQSLPPIPDVEPPTSLPTLRVDAEAGFACTGFSIRGLPAIGLQVSRNDPPLAFLVLDADQLAELLGRARELLGTSA